MQIGINIQLPGIRGASNLDYTLPDSDQHRKIKVYLVPVSVSVDQYYISITMPGAIEDVPSCRGKDFLLIADYHLSETGETTINYIDEELKNA